MLDLMAHKENAFGNMKGMRMNLLIHLYNVFDKRSSVFHQHLS